MRSGVGLDCDIVDLEGFVNMGEIGLGRVWNWYLGSRIHGGASSRLFRMSGSAADCKGILRESYSAIDILNIDPVTNLRTYDRGSSTRCERAWHKNNLTGQLFLYIQSYGKANNSPNCGNDPSFEPWRLCFLVSPRFLTFCVKLPMS